jgi:RNA polymerase sigma factor (sigma-70 family)
MLELDDNALLREYVVHASEQAFATLVTRHVNKVYSVALRYTRNSHEAEEITQAVFVILARKSRHLGKAVILSGWLYQTARLTAMTSIRSEIRRARREQEACMQNLVDETESRAWPQIAPLLDAAMGALSETDRHAVVLRFFDGKSIKEVGLALGASEDAAKMRLNRAVEKLRLFFTKRGVVHPAEVLTATISAHSVHAAPAALAKAVASVAFAKGAAASSSTLTLIKGTLKIMAWTKTKTAAVATVVALLALGTTAVMVNRIHTARIAAHHDIQGAWEGILALSSDARTRLVLRFFKKNGEYDATGDAIDGAERNIPIAVNYHYPSLRLSVNPRTEFDAKVNEDGTELVINGNIVLKRTTTPDPAPERLAEEDFAPRAGSDLQGYWKGSLGDSPDGLPLSWKISQQADGTFHAEMDNVMQGAGSQPVSVVYSRPKVTLRVATGEGMFQGDINSDKTQITGAWLQGGGSIPMTVKRVDYQAEQVLDGVKNYSYKSENDLQGHWKGTWILPYGPVKVKMRFVLDIAKLSDGAFAATLANIDQLGNSDPIPASDFHYAAPDVRMAWKWAGGRFEGKLKSGKLTGTWHQGRDSFALVFERQL